MRLTFSRIVQLSRPHPVIAAVNAANLWLCTPYSAYRFPKKFMSANELENKGARVTFSCYPYKLWDTFRPDRKELYKGILRCVYSDTDLFYVYKIGKFYVKINMRYVPNGTAYMKAKKGAPHKSPIFCFNLDNELIAVVMPVQLQQDVAREKYAPHK